MKDEIKIKEIAKLYADLVYPIIGSEREDERIWLENKHDLIIQSFIRGYELQQYITDYKWTQVGTDWIRPNKETIADEFLNSLK